jgi:hypothetical protein
MTTGQITDGCSRPCNADSLPYAHPLFGTTGRLRGVPPETVSRQIGLICTPQLVTVEGALAAPNGGSASVLPDLPRHSA